MATIAAEQDYSLGIGDEIQLASSLSTILNFYIEDHCDDQALLTVSLELTRRLDSIKAKHAKELLEKRFNA